MHERCAAAAAPAGPWRRRAWRVRRASSSQGLIAACSVAPSSPGGRCEATMTGPPALSRNSSTRVAPDADAACSTRPALARVGGRRSARFARAAAAAAVQSARLLALRTRHGLLVLRRNHPAPSNEGAGAVYRRTAPPPNPSASPRGLPRGDRMLRRHPCIDPHSEAPCGCSRPRRDATRTRPSGFLPFASHRLETRQCPGATARTRGHPARQANPSAFPAPSPRA